MINKKSILLAVGACFLMTTSLSADIKKGQKGYLKTCKKCHGNGTKGAAMNTQAGWTELFADNGALIISKHASIKKAKKTFKGKRFKKVRPHLKDFLFEYASDSGNVPSCG